MQLMVEQLWKSLARSHTGAIELVIRIVHLITTEHSFQATLIERLVMSHQRKSFNQWLYLCPHLWEHRGIFCILSSQAMYLRTPIIIVVRLRLNQGIERIHYLAIAYYHHAHRADTGPLVVGSLKVYCCKVCYIYQQLLCWMGILLAHFLSLTSWTDLQAVVPARASISSRTRCAKEDALSNKPYSSSFRHSPSCDNRSV